MNTRLTLAQSEDLKIGERKEYLSDSESFNARIKALKITCFVKKLAAKVTKDDKALQQFIDIPLGYKLIYGITFNGIDYECGDMPRDIGKVIKGIEIAKQHP